jgi:o-succinylbenzoate synthase
MTMERFSLPLAELLSTAHGPIESREGFLVRFDHRGETGIGEATPLPGWTESLEDCERALETALETDESDGHTAALLELDAGTVPAARHGFATALLDADARADGVSLARWFDPDASRGSVPVNATIGDGDVEETTAAARAAVEDGFDCLKLKAGVRAVEDDVERVRATRRAVGDDVTLRVDANGAWDAEAAQRALDAFDDLGVSYVEQPLPASDLEGHGGLDAGSVGIAIDESFREYTAAEVLDAGVADVAILKPMVLGGPGNAHTIAMRARDVGIEPVVTTTVDAVVARAAAVHVAAAIPAVEPCGLATADLLAEDLAADPAPVADGRISVPDGPGLGIDHVEVE